jgi:rubrerythrin
MGSDEVRESLLKIVRLLDKGIAMETHARDFYAAAARRSEAPQGKRMFEWLAQFEAGHKARLEAKRNDFAEHAALAGVRTPVLEDYDVSEADESVKLPENATDMDVLKLGIDNELRAYAFYEKKYTYATDESLRAMLDTMARDEDKHIKILREQLEHLELNRVWAEMDKLEKSIRDFG